MRDRLNNTFQKSIAYAGSRALLSLFRRPWQCNVRGSRDIPVEQVRGQTSLTMIEQREEEGLMAKHLLSLGGLKTVSPRLGSSLATIVPRLYI